MFIYIIDILSFMVAFDFNGTTKGKLYLFVREISFVKTLLILIYPSMKYSFFNYLLISRKLLVKIAISIKLNKFLFFFKFKSSF